MPRKEIIALLLVIPLAFLIIVCYVLIVKTTFWQIMTENQAIITLVLLAVVSFLIVLPILRWTKDFINKNRYNSRG